MGRPVGGENYGDVDRKIEWLMQRLGRVSIGPSVRRRHERLLALAEEMRRVGLYSASTSTADITAGLPGLIERAWRRKWLERH